MEDFTIMMTATLRPELIKKTLDSFIKNLFKEDSKKAILVLNIDKVGCAPGQESGKFREILEYIADLPVEDVVFNYPQSPSFGKAFNWCVKRLNTHFVFNLEEDWELQYPVDFQAMVSTFDDHDLAHLRLSAFDSTEQNRLKTWNKFNDWNGQYYEVPTNLRGTIGWAGHPSLNRSAFLMFFGTIMNPEKNPEKQIKGKYPIIQNSKFGIWHKPFAPASIKDLGREWMIANRWQKAGNPAVFTQWEKVMEAPR